MQVKHPFEFEKVAFFGRSIDEYVKMFNLDLASLKGKSILDCCAGPAAFACQAADRGIKVTACDPLYGLDIEILRFKVEQDIESIGKKHADNPSLIYPQVSIAERCKAMQLFLDDFEKGKASGRYIPGHLPNLPFSDRAFDLVLSANFLFLYSDKESGGLMTHSQFDYAFHSKAIAELIRLSKGEVRIYPLQGPNIKQHAYLSGIMNDFTTRGMKVELIPVQQRDLLGADQMLQISR